jgi:hypothetical protein
MSAFTESGRSEVKIAEDLKGCFRPKAAIRLVEKFASAPRAKANFDH